MEERQRENLIRIGFAAAGVFAMYLLDPKRGARRRGIVRDKAYHYLRASEHEVEKKGRHYKNRLHGVAARARRRVPGVRGVGLGRRQEYADSKKDFTWRSAWDRPMHLNERSLDRLTAARMTDHNVR